MSNISPFLWFDDRAEEAAKFYVSVFKNAKLGRVVRYGESAAKASGKPKGSVMTVAFRLEGQELTALNGGPQFPFSPAVSLVVKCATQKELDRLWGKLAADPDAGQCGWLVDKFGVSWQLVPAELERLLRAPEKAERVMKAILGMKKLDVAALRRA